MKKLLPLSLAALFAVPVMAQEGGNQRHMFLFDADSILQGVYSLSENKVPGKKEKTDSQLRLNLNYFYTIPQLQKLQFGGGLTYAKDTGINGDTENYGAQVGAIWNFKDDLTNSLYVKGLAGLTWNQEYGGEGSGSDETYNLTAALGRRFSLANWGMNHVVYSPELAWVGRDSTTSADFDHSSELQLRFLQFSVFF